MTYQGRGIRFKEETIKNTSQEQWEQEFECQFLGSSNTLINPNALRNMAYKHPEYDKEGVTVFEKAQEGRTYVCTVDVSRGVGIDYSAFVILDVTKMPFKVVCKYRSNDISPLMYPTIINRMASHYNDAYILVEINDIGQQVADILNSEIEYENLLSTTWKGRAGQVLGGGFGGGTTLGARTTGQLKRLGCSNLKNLIEENKLIIQDFDIINELSTFVARKGSYEAEEGSHDDLAMCLVMFAWLSGQPYFKELTENDIREKLYKEKMQAIEDELLPFGFISGDTNDVESFTDADGDRWVVVEDRSW